MRRIWKDFSEANLWKRFEPGSHWVDAGLEEGSQSAEVEAVYLRGCFDGLRPPKTISSKFLIDRR
jgi:hypothetical protein